MKRILLIAALLATLAGCQTGRPAGEPSPGWERNDPARRVYGGGL